MIFPSKAEVECVPQEYPVGTIVKLLERFDCQAPPIGTLGEVTGVDDTAACLLIGRTAVVLMCFSELTVCKKLMGLLQSATESVNFGGAEKKMPISFLRV